MTKRRILALLGCLALVALAGAAGQAQESLPPVSIGSGQTVTQFSNGQGVQITASGISATVYFSEISPNRIAGVAMRTSGGTTSGTVRILWTNENKTKLLSLSAGNPEQIFGLEGGDGAKRKEDSSELR